MALALNSLFPLLWSWCPLLAITGTATPVPGLPRKEALLPAASFSKPWGTLVRRRDPRI